MIVTQYETHFVDLDRHALLLLPTEEERVRRFIDGLTHPNRLQMAKETGSEISFQMTANVARRIEMVLAQERGHGPDKRPRQFGGFSGASSGGRGNFGRGRPPKPFHSGLQASHGASASYGPIFPYSRQPTFSTYSAPISAPPLQSHHNSYLVRSGQLYLQQPWQHDGCYVYGNISHIKRYCPRLSSNKSRHNSRAIIPAPVASPNAQPARGGSQAVRGRGQPVRGHPRDTVHSGGAQPRFYAFRARPEIESSDAVITDLLGMLPKEILTYVLI
ncbi:uncharacterized protein [Nicotiana tomentosiformis]|uniref:uncharacterized protein n=1 Tax=Nicotiana tomentosiformis TaxID=4098 RepID=UPI00388CA018